MKLRSSKNQPPIERYNACNEPCDVIDGPCCCGAWHTRKEWRFIIAEHYHQNNLDPYQHFEECYEPDDCLICEALDDFMYLD